MLHLLRAIIILCVIVAPPACAEESQPLPDIAGQELSEKVNSALQQATEKKNTIILPDKSQLQTGEEAAKKVNDTYRSPAFQEKIAKEMERLETFIPGEKRPKEQEEKKKKEIAETEQLYLFLSASIPDETIRNYMADLDIAKDVIVVMYGVVGGLKDKNQMGEWYKLVSRKDPLCEDKPEKRCERYEVKIKIKPGLFRQYAITAVPALVYAEGDKEPIQIAGDMSLSAMLERVNKEVKSPGLENLISKVKR